MAWPTDKRPLTNGCSVLRHLGAAKSRTMLGLPKFTPSHRDGDGGAEAIGHCAMDLQSARIGHGVGDRSSPAQAKVTTLSKSQLFRIFFVIKSRLRVANSIVSTAELRIA
jgi:hypothetical protein